MKKSHHLQNLLVILVFFSLLSTAALPSQTNPAVTQTLKDTAAALNLKMGTEQDYKKIEQLMNLNTLASGQVIEIAGAAVYPGEVNPGLQVLGFNSKKAKMLDAALGTYQLCQSKAAASIYDTNIASGKDFEDFLRISGQGFAPELAAQGMTEENLQKLRQMGFKIETGAVKYGGSAIQFMSIPKFTRDGKESGRKDYAAWKSGIWLFQVALETTFNGEKVVKNSTFPERIEYPSCPLSFNPGPGLQAWYQALHDAAVRNGLIGDGPFQPPAQPAGEFISPQVVIRDQPRDASSPGYLGVVADGISTLPVHLINDDPQRFIQARIDTPALGKLVDSRNQSLSGQTVEIEPGGIYTLYYAPPVYLTPSQLTEVISPTDSNDDIVFAAPADLNFGFDSDDWPSGIPVTARILVFRPPIQMVHGYFGSADTWQFLKTRLSQEKFDAVAGTYLPGFENSSIESMAENLEVDIRNIQDRYKNKQVKITRVDVITHSMGGLITRQYMTYNENYKNIRKLLMLATPNHGVNDFIGLEILRVGASALLNKQIAASIQLNSVNVFFDRINQGEATLQHLEPSVEYANIIGRASCGQLCPHDAVVDVASAHLNGVKEYVFNKTIHSSSLLSGEDYYISESKNPYFSYSDIGITDSQPVADLVIQLMNRTIERSDPDPKWSLVLSYFEGPVYVSKIDGTNQDQITDYPVSLPMNYMVETRENGKAVVILYLNGVEVKRIELNQNTKISYGAVNGNELSLWLVNGQGRFERKFDSSGRMQGGGFNITVGQRADIPSGKMLSPAMLVSDLQTAFVVSADEPPSVTVLDGNVQVTTFSADGQPVRISETIPADPAIAKTIDAYGSLAPAPAPPSPWWEEPVYRQNYPAPSWALETKPSKSAGDADYGIFDFLTDFVDPGIYLAVGGFCAGTSLFVFLVIVVASRKKKKLASSAAHPLPPPGSAAYPPNASPYPSPQPAFQSKRSTDISSCLLIAAFIGILISILIAILGLLWWQDYIYIPIGNSFSRVEDAYPPAQSSTNPAASGLLFEAPMATNPAPPPHQNNIELKPMDETSPPQVSETQIQPSSGDGTGNLPSAWGFAACLEPCLPDLSNSITTFPGGAKQVYFRFNYANIPPGAEVTRRWSSDGWVWVRYECLWDGPPSGVFEASLKEPGGLKSGPWELEIVVENRAILNQTINLDGAHTFWSPAGVITGRCK